MDMTALSFLSMFALLVASNLFWFYKCDRLLNKLMSRNYAEYAQVQKYLEPDKPVDGSELNSVDPLDEQKAREINGLFGFGV